MRKRILHSKIEHPCPQICPQLIKSVRQAQRQLVTDYFLLTGPLHSFGTGKVMRFKFYIQAVYVLLLPLDQELTSKDHDHL